MIVSLVPEGFGRELRGAIDDSRISDHERVFRDLQDLEAVVSTAARLGLLTPDVMCQAAAKLSIILESVGEQTASRRCRPFGFRRRTARQELPTADAFGQLQLPLG
jgi:hypothetical protein